MFNSDTQTVLTVTSISRPKRVAFLVHSEKIDNNGINQIIRYSIGTWGGRFHAIIPTSGEEIAPAWWKLLTILDPDIIYSFLPLADKLIRRINRYILPAKIIEPNDRVKVEDTYRIDTFTIGALGIEDIPRFKWESRRFLDEPSFFYIKEGKEDTQNNSFVLRNFGTLPKTADLSVESLFRDIRREIIEPNEMTPAEILENIFEKAKTYPRKIIVPIDFCQMYTFCNYSLDYNESTKGIHIVVGNQPFDAIYAWNRALISDMTFGSDVFWLAEEHSQDENLLRLMSRWINEFWAGNMETPGKIVSYSMDATSLQNLAKKMSELTRLHFKPIRINPDNFPCPNARKFIPKLLERGQECRIDKVPLSENKGLVGFQRPPFLFKGHPQFGWMVDLEIQYHPERYNWTNVRPTWKLPKRLGLAHKFFDNYKRSSRIVNGGLPSIETATEDTVIHISIPSDLAVVRTWLEYYPNTSKHHPQTTPLFTEIHVSDKGRYLQGIIRLFGNIYSAGNIFEDPFWRDVLLRMVGKPDYQNDFTEIKKIVHKSINDIFAEDTTPLEAGSPRLDQFAEKLAYKLLSIDVKSNELTVEQLRGRFAQLRGEVLKKDPKNGWWNANEKFDELKEQELQNLLETKVFLQGLELSCPHCGTRQWYVVDDLYSGMRCNRCLFHFTLPPNPSWSLRLNDLVQNAVRKHGTLAVLHTLYELQRDSSSEMFLYLPCQDIFKADGNAPFTDLDIVVINKGKFIIGEVKSDPGGFKHPDFEKLREVAIELLPDEILLAAPGDNWPNNVLVEIRNLTDALKKIDVTVSPRLLQWL